MVTAGCSPGLQWQPLLRFCGISETDKERVAGSAGRNSPLMQPPERDMKWARGNQAERHSGALDIIRGGAALLVVVGHTRSLFFVDYAAAERGLGTRILYAVTGMGHEAVMVFFVLSGFLVGGSVSSRVARGAWKWRTYVVRRVVRLLVVLIPALVLTAWWDKLGLFLFSATVYMGTPADRFIIPRSVAHSLGAGTFLGNLAFLQGIAVAVYGSNGPLWSLSYEWWYYILFPCIALSFSEATWRRRVLYGAGAVAISFAIGLQVTAYFLIWVIGVVVASTRDHVCRSHVVYTIWIYSMGAACGAVLIIARLLTLRGLSGDVSVAIGFAAFLHALTRVHSPIGSVRTRTRVGAFAVISGSAYTLYLTHMPLLVFFHAAVSARQPNKWTIQLSPIGAATAIIATVVAYAWVVASLTEHRTSRFQVLASASLTRMEELGVRRWSRRVLLDACSAARVLSTCITKPRSLLP